jgi:hypothetical protein
MQRWSAWLHSSWQHSPKGHPLLQGLLLLLLLLLLLAHVFEHHSQVAGLHQGLNQHLEPQPLLRCRKEPWRQHCSSLRNSRPLNPLPGPNLM